VCEGCKRHIEERVIGGPHGLIVRVFARRGWPVRL
jgi:hypothetical protein